MYLDRIWLSKLGHQKMNVRKVRIVLNSFSRVRTQNMEVIGNRIKSELLINKNLIELIKSRIIKTKINIR